MCSSARRPIRSACVLNQCLDEIEPLSERIEPGCASAKPHLRDLTGSVTPYHLTRRSISCCRSAAARQSVYQRVDRSLSEGDWKGTYRAIRRNMVFHERYRNDHGLELKRYASTFRPQTRTG